MYLENEIRHKSMLMLVVESKQNENKTTLDGGIYLPTPINNMRYELSTMHRAITSGWADRGIYRLNWSPTHTKLSSYGAITIQDEAH